MKGRCPQDDNRVMKRHAQPGPPHGARVPGKSAAEGVIQSGILDGTFSARWGDMGQEESFAVEAQPVHGAQWITIRGRVGYRDAHRLREALLAEVHDGDSNIVIDLDQVESMDTAGVAVLVESLRATLARDRKMLLYAPSESVLNIFRVSGLDGALDSCCGCKDEMRRKLSN